MILEIHQRCTCAEHPNVNLAQKALLQIYGMIFLTITTLYRLSFALMNRNTVLCF